MAVSHGAFLLELSLWPGVIWGTSENDENSSQSYFIVKSEEDIFQTKEKSVVQGEIRATIKGCNVYNILLKYKIVGIKLNRKT